MNVSISKQRRNLIVFCLVVLVSGWVGVFADKTIPNQENGGTLGMLIWLVVPFIASLLLRSFGKDGWNDTGLKPKLKGNLRWYLLSLFLFPVIILLIILVGVGINGVGFASFTAKSVIPLMVGSFVGQFVKNIFEEFVWRGYLTGKLEKLGVSDWNIYIVVGIVWGLWHLPYNLVFIALADIQSIIPVNRIAFTLINLLTTFSLTIFYTELYRIVKSIWPSVLFHTISNMIVNSLFVGNFISITNGKEILLSPVLGVIPLALYVLIGLALRKYRIKFLINVNK